MKARKLNPDDMLAIDDLVLMLRTIDVCSFPTGAIANGAGLFVFAWEQWKERNAHEAAKIEKAREAR